MENPTAPYTYRDLFTKLQALTPAQLDQQVRHINEREQGKAIGLWVLEEPHFNPSGEGLEPISNYRPKEGEVFNDTEHMSEEAIAEEQTWPTGLVMIELA